MQNVRSKSTPTIHVISMLHGLLAPPVDAWNFVADFELRELTDLPAKCW